MNNQQLHDKLINLSTLERKTLSEILELLRLNFKRKVFAKMGYSHLTKYMMKESFSYPQVLGPCGLAIEI